MQKGRLKNLRRPIEPWYRDRHPDDHNLSKQDIDYYISAFNKMKGATHYNTLPRRDAGASGGDKLRTRRGKSFVTHCGWIAQCSSKAGARVRARYAQMNHLFFTQN